MTKTVEQLIELVEDPAYINSDRYSGMKELSDFLRTLQQPQDHAELVGDLKSLRIALVAVSHETSLDLNKISLVIDKAIAALSRPTQPQPLEDEWVKACADAGSLLLASDDDGNITGFEIDAISGGAKYTDGFPDTITLSEYGLETNDVEEGRMTYVQQPFDVRIALLDGKKICRKEWDADRYLELKDGIFYNTGERVVDTWDDIVNIGGWSLYHPPEPAYSDGWYWIEYEEDTIYHRPTHPCFIKKGNMPKGGAIMTNPATGKPWKIEAPQG